MGSWLLPVVLVGVFLAMNLVGLIVNRRIGRSPSPRATRKRYRWVVFNQALSLGVLAFLLLSQGTPDLQMVLLVGVMVASTGPLVWLAVRRQTEDDARKNYAHDTGHCGRCEYDLTGNVSGICPECGWAIPETPMRLQDPRWARWWRGWEIEYLENWPRSLRTVRLNVVMFGAIAVGALVWLLAYQPESPWFGILLSLPAWLIAGHMLILSVRIAAYGRKQKSNVGESESRSS